MRKYNIRHILIFWKQQNHKNYTFRIELAINLSNRNNTRPNKNPDLNMLLSYGWLHHQEDMRLHSQKRTAQIESGDILSRREQKDKIIRRTAGSGYGDLHTLFICRHVKIATPEVVTTPNGINLESKNINENRAMSCHFTKKRNDTTYS